MSAAQLQVLLKEAEEEEEKEKKELKQKYQQRRQKEQKTTATNTDLQELIQQAQQQEQNEKEQLRQKYKQRLQQQSQTLTPTNTNQQELIQQAQQQEQNEKEQLRQKYKQRLQEQSQKPTNTNQEELVEPEPTEKEQIIEKLKQSVHQTAAENPETDKLYQRALGIEVENDTIDSSDRPQQDADTLEELNEIYEENDSSFNDEDISSFNDENNSSFNDENDISSEYSPDYHSKSDEWQNNELEEYDEKLDEIKELEKSEDVFEDVFDNAFQGYVAETGLDTDLSATEELLEETHEADLIEETHEIETVEENHEIDRAALLAKYNIQDVHEHDVDRILENFDRPLFEGNIEQVEEKIVSNIKRSVMSHSKIEWVNVLIFLDQEKLEGNIQIFAEYSEGGFLNRLLSASDEERLELELIQIALYEIWDIFTTLGINIDDLESKIDVEVQLERN